MTCLVGIQREGKREDAKGMQGTTVVIQIITLGTQFDYPFVHHFVLWLQMLLVLSQEDALTSNVTYLYFNSCLSKLIIFLR